MFRAIFPSMEQNTERPLTLTFRCPAWLRARIEEQAQREERSLSYIVNRVLEQLERYDFDLSNVPGLSESKRSRPDSAKR